MDMCLVFDSSVGAYSFGETLALIREKFFGSQPTSPASNLNELIFDVFLTEYKRSVNQICVLGFVLSIMSESVPSHQLVFKIFSSKIISIKFCLFFKLKRKIEQQTKIV